MPGAVASAPPPRASSFSSNARFDPVTLTLLPSGSHPPPHRGSRGFNYLADQSGHTRSRRTITLGRPLPHVLMKVVHFLLGISPSHPKQNITGKIFYGLTFFVSLGYLISSLVFIHMDILSDFTKTTVVDGTVTCLFIVLWCVLGIYANGLAYRLYDSDHFRPMIRLPSKTIFGINSAVMLLLLMILTMAVNNYSGLWMFNGANCDKLKLAVAACQFRYAFRVAFSVLALLWHYLVTFVLIAVSRSFTINIRQLMQTLERDGRAYESHYMGVKYAGEEDMLLQEYTWLDEDFCAEMQHQQISGSEAVQVLQLAQEQQLQQARQDISSRNAPSVRRSSSCVNLVSQADPDDVATTADGGLDCTLVNSSTTTPSCSTPSSTHQATLADAGGGAACYPGAAVPSSSSLPSTPSIAHSSATAQAAAAASSPLTRLSCRSSSSSSSGGAVRQRNSLLHVCDPASTQQRADSPAANTCAHCAAGAPSTMPLLSNAEILYEIWKIQTGLRIFGLATQRWMLSLVCLIITWLVINLVLWLQTSPGLMDLVNLILPLLLLPMLAATYAEVNFEGNRLVKFIAPTEERLGVLYFLQQSPLELPIYGFTLSYTTITTAGFGLLIALASRVFLQEITGDGC